VAFATNEALAGYRPGKLEVNDSALAEHVSGLLADADIGVEYRPKLLAVDRFLAEAARDMLGEPVPPGALQGKGVTVERMRGFAEAAKSFYQAEPWTELGTVDLIEVEVPPPPDPSLRFPLVLGGGGQEFGLAFYRSPEHYWGVSDAEDPYAYLTSQGGIWFLTFDDITEMPFADADLWEDHSLPVAGDHAYPVADCFDPSGRRRRPNAGVLAFLEGLMRAITAAGDQEMDSGRWTKKVQTFDGPVEYTLSLPFLLHPPDHKELYQRGFLDRRAMEISPSQAHRFLEGKHFRTAEELDEALNREFVGKPVDRTRYQPRNVLEEAQDLCYQAFDSIGRRRAALARQAIRLCPDCADAYVILAEGCGDTGKAGELYAAGVEAGRRALGGTFFEENVGHFWGLLQTRPFMRALQGQAECLVGLGRQGDAVGHYRELLRLNPNDNQGVRHALLPLLIELGRDAEAEDLLKAYHQDVSAIWPYCRALLAFRSQGDTPASRTLLAAAVKANPHVPKCVLGQAELSDWPGSYSLGSEEEAVFCAAQIGGAWEASAGALEWLTAKANSPGESSSRRKPRPRRKTKS